MKRVIKARSYTPAESIFCAWASSVRVGDTILNDGEEFYVARISEGNSGSIVFTNEEGRDCCYEVSDQVRIL